jgi:hypothetical protein
LGVALLVGSIILWVLNLGSTLSPTLLAIGGALLLIVGFSLFVADFFEAFLSRGQTALVDGLQAG